ncbi:MAG TPA: GxxExxY protein [Balneolaceae bacterium]|nr:GxxExxY protein [Balneolaceae bacterium]
MYKHGALTGKIIKGYYEVYNELGTGFLESVYENAFKYVLKQHNLNVTQQKPIKVYFREKIVGNFTADLMVEDKVIIELKAVNKLVNRHKAQTINYLKATDIDVALLMNFGSKPDFKRFIFDKKRIIRQ